LAVTPADRNPVEPTAAPSDATPSEPASVAPSASPEIPTDVTLDAALARCPTEAELALVDAVVILTVVDDPTAEEMGAWAIHHYVWIWLAEHAHSAYMTPVNAAPDLYERAAVIASRLSATSFCSLPSPSPGRS